MFAKKKLLNLPLKIAMGWAFFCLGCLSSASAESEPADEILITFDQTVTGTVTSKEENFGIPGVTVLVKGSTIGTTTDSEGKYSITVPSENDVLVFSAVGYLSQERAVGNASMIDITLATDLKILDEVVVVGYGTQKKRDLTGAVSQINATKLDNENPQSVQDILRGNIAGLNVGMSPSAKGGG